MKQDLIKTSKFLSLVLRHQPQTIGMTLDSSGWAEVEDLIARANRHRQNLTIEKLREVVETNDKKRFTFSDDGKKIRAAQGHSIDVDLELKPKEPPGKLFHGTADRNLESIRREGLSSKNRQYVHLSIDWETAGQVGQRHGRPVILTVRTGAMHQAGFQFFLSENDVWLIDRVPPEFLELPN